MCLEKRAGAHLHTCEWVSFCKQCAYTYMLLLRRGDRALISRVNRVVRDTRESSEEFSVVCCGRVLLAYEPRTAPATGPDHSVLFFEHLGSRAGGRAEANARQRGGPQHGGSPHVATSVNLLDWA